VHILRKTLGSRWYSGYPTKQGRHFESFRGSELIELDTFWLTRRMICSNTLDDLRYLSFRKILLVIPQKNGNGQF
jgi:hypothetical protein